MLPPLSKYRLQPIDVKFIVLLNAYHKQEVQKWLLGRSLRIYQFGNLLKALFSIAAVQNTAIRGYEKAGICPYKSDIFPDHLFYTSETSEKSAIVSNSTPRSVITYKATGWHSCSNRYFYNITGLCRSTFYMQKCWHHTYSS